MSTAGLIHTSFAITALLLGGSVVAQRKGTRPHRALGQLYALSMLGVNVTAFMIYGLFGQFGPFHALAAVSLATLLAGLAPAVVRRPRGTWPHFHAHFMSWSYVGLVAAAAAEAAVRLPIVRALGVGFAAAVLVPTLAVVALGGWIIARKVPRIVTNLDIVQGS